MGPRRASIFPAFACSRRFGGGRGWWVMRNAAFAIPATSLMWPTSRATPRQQRIGGGAFGRGPTVSVAPSASSIERLPFRLFAAWRASPTSATDASCGAISSRERAQLGGALSGLWRAYTFRFRSDDSALFAMLLPLPRRRHHTGCRGSAVLRQGEAPCVGQSQPLAEAPVPIVRCRRVSIPFIVPLVDAGRPSRQSVPSRRLPGGSGSLSRGEHVS